MWLVGLWIPNNTTPSTGSLQASAKSCRSFFGGVGSWDKRGGVEEIWMHAIRVLIMQLIVGWCHELTGISGWGSR